MAAYLEFGPIEEGAHRSIIEGVFCDACDALVVVQFVCHNQFAFSKCLIIIVVLLFSDRVLNLHLYLFFDQSIAAHKSLVVTKPKIGVVWTQRLWPSLKFSNQLLDSSSSLRFGVDGSRVVDEDGDWRVSGEDVGVA